eukprot:CAMPEP_0179217986 /NCGR_PEP_ID=MMETSP0797-20121207/4219_1 /TAXON_ID=47934 /ORGANISM="Dinophysis acuminata, Strain DAEP01" /LENGTH=97 /DNA_ID=CAMNT_0020924277 /DNA_START=872 /DNA_END=1163 /DNA_ORIENTATION=-
MRALGGTSAGRPLTMKVWDRSSNVRAAWLVSSGPATGRDVVAHPEHRAAAHVLGNLPDVVHGVAVPDVPVVVVPAGEAAQASRRRLVEGGLLLPNAA